LDIYKLTGKEMKTGVAPEEKEGTATGMPFIPPGRRRER
jgi:hypothetical protein